MSIPQPAFTVDFETGESNLPGGFKLMEGAAVKDGAPGAVAKALRIDSDGPYVLFPNLDISPSKFPELSMIIEFYLESIPEGSKGWLLNHDNGGYDRALVLHDERFGGISHGVGFPAGPVYDSYTTPEVGKWVQMVVTYRQGGECAVFVSNEKAPITHEGRNNDGKSSLTLGRVVPYKNHWCDCWIKGVSVYDKGLSDEEVGSIFGKFKEEIIVPSGEASDDESVDEGEETDEEPTICEGGDGHIAVQNIALGKPASQSTTFPKYGGVASNAVNGSTTGKRKNANSTVTCTADGDDSPWWEVDLEGLHDICKINVFNRDSKHYHYKLKDFTVEVLRGGKVVWSSGSQTEIPEPEAIISIPGGTTGDSVRVSKNTKHLILAEVQVWGTPSLEVDTGSTSDDATYASSVQSSQWKMIGDGGRLKQVSISASGEHLWGVNSKDNIYYRAGFNGSWKLIGGSLKYVSVSSGGNHVWGVNVHDDVYYRAGVNAGRWTKIDGKLKQICVSADGAHVWGVSSEDHIYYKAGIEDGSWKRIAGALKQVCVSATGKHVWGVNTHDHVYYRAGVSAGSWTKIDGSLKHISVSAGGNHVWGVTSEDHIYYREGLSAAAWTKSYGALKQVCVSADGRHVWGVNSKDEIWYRFITGWSVPTPPTNTPVISITTGDQFNYGPWGGNCLAFFAAGVLYMNRIGSSVQGIKTWKCKDAADTKKLLNGETVMVEWDNSGKYLKMTATDNDTFKVMHGSTAYYFKRA